MPDMPSNMYDSLENENLNEKKFRPVFLNFYSRLREIIFSKLSGLNLKLVHLSGQVNGVVCK